MNLTIDRAPLLRALSHAQSIVTRNSFVPIMSHLALHAEQDLLTIRASDYNMELEETVPARVIQPGCITAPAHLLYALVGRIADGAEIGMSMTDNGRLRVSGGRARSDMPTLPYVDFPALKMMGDPIEFAMPASTVSSVLKRVEFAAAADNSANLYLQGVYLHVIDGLMVWAAADTFTLAETARPLVDGAEDLPGTLMPNKLVAQLIKLGVGSDATMRLEIGKNLIRVTAGNVTITSKMIDCTYPDYRKIFQQVHNRKAEADRPSLMAMLNRAAVFCEGVNKVLIIRFGDGELSISAGDAEEFSEALEIHYEGEPLRLGMNCVKLTEICAAIKGDGIRIKLGESGVWPVISDPADDGVRYVLPPLRV